MARPETILDCLDDATRKRVDEALLSARDENVADIYRRFGLAQREVSERGFYAYAKRLRERFENRSDGEPAAPAIGRPRAMETLHRLFDAMNERLDAGDPDSMPGIATAMRAVNDCMRLTLEEEAQRRAAELHEARLKKLEPAIKDAISEPTTQGSKDLREILEGVSGGTLSIDAATRRIGDVLWIEIDKQMRGVA